jgi:hypothetical protein
VNAPLSREAAIDGLAEILHWKMDHLDPGEYPAWSELDEDGRDYYRLCIEAILAATPLIKIALGG